MAHAFILTRQFKTRRRDRLVRYTEVLLNMMHVRCFYYILFSTWITLIRNKHSCSSVCRNIYFKINVLSQCSDLTFWIRVMDRRRNSRRGLIWGPRHCSLSFDQGLTTVGHPCVSLCMEVSTRLTCALSKVLHCDVLVLSTGYGPQLALVGIGHPIWAAHLLHSDRDGAKGEHVNSLQATTRMCFHSNNLFL